MNKTLKQMRNANNFANMDQRYYAVSGIFLHVIISLSLSLSSLRSTSVGLALKETSYENKQLSKPVIIKKVMFFKTVFNVRELL